MGNCLGGGDEKKQSARQALVANVLGQPHKDIKQQYTIGRELGRGQFGVTYLCTDKKSAQQFAVKTISKRKLMNKDDVDDVKREVQIMKHLTGKDNIVELYSTFEDKSTVYLVMELCQGGELFDRIVSKGHYTEKAASAVCRTIVKVVHTCHSHGVIHRDLKPENFLLANKREDAPVKATDFGLSVFFRSGQVFREIVGSAYYVAPEVLKKSYGPEADVWSAGVILYVLLAGVPPFWAETEQGIFEAVLRGHLDLNGSPWPTISASAKDLVRKMLKPNPRERLSAADVLQHPWIKEDGDAPDKLIDGEVLSRMKNFSAMNKLKKVALKIISESLSEEEIIKLKDMFKQMDTDNSGTITFEELKAGLAKQGSNMIDAEIRQLMEAADVDGNGTIDYLEFIQASMHLNKMDRGDHLHAAFQNIDTDGSGYITMEELEAALVKHGLGVEDAKDIIKEVDTDNDGRINYDEFCAMMLKRNSPPAGAGHRRSINDLPVGIKK
ncbi:calcium dependent protein kinase 34 [Selaginella moellendorffii]|uniref:non-specific serine/threonine protein kinase n=1 Tax=Selaginella moellendorffii TaxID=88036 RepID=D8T7J7_SELML|nr:calcium-dependent protein kinase 17 [Selaginella moellendorffii]EFJ07310.1 calcium dependent protein kinase 34 [Selaginella moellendorffii]|eukprot:XP_002991556.1 calcium-dependent protein kinase 17 [Selaginella moellendorffii]